MWDLIKFAHLAAALVWLGGMGFMLFALRPAVVMPAPPERLALVAETLRRFFAMVWVVIAVLLASGLAMLAHAGARNAPLGWYLMSGTGLLMFALFAHLYAGPYRRMRRAVEVSDWPTAAAQMKRILPLAMSNFVLGWLAILALRFVG